MTDTALRAEVQSTDKHTHYIYFGYAEYIQKTLQIQLYNGIIINNSCIKLGFYNFLLQSGTKTAKYKSRYAQRTAQERRIIMIEIKIAIDNIQYGDLAKQFIPQLTEHLQKVKPDNKIIHMLARMQNMPGAIAKQMLDALPQDTKDELAAYFINQNKETLLSALGNFMEGKGIKADVTDFSVKRNQETDRKKEAEYRARMALGEDGLEQSARF